MIGSLNMILFKVLRGGPRSGDGANLIVNFIKLINTTELLPIHLPDIWTRVYLSAGNHADINPPSRRARSNWYSRLLTVLIKFPLLCRENQPHSECIALWIFYIRPISSLHPEFLAGWATGFRRTRNKANFSIHIKYYHYSLYLLAHILLNINFRFCLLILWPSDFDR